MWSVGYSVKMNISWVYRLNARMFGRGESYERVGARLTWALAMRLASLLRKLTLGAE